ncbi:hypothetical protein [Alkaliphilus peptidifermentans]|uniref:DUF8195 domain-containing protein n=1 Tax=Alkaliphilus peptidifermentans DSM 18978 TaxID=1120976 RepID=A0A1G5DS73_9FIRM|nr:hypothetical protein [Alkaliphilus peptidifermentans]SCY17612.1 hypothetical protein SAMN03080606_00999 [Alkaliphilus peptidifermentans DSM 18978]
MKYNNKITISVLIAILLLSITISHANFEFGGLDYINTQGKVVSFGGNLWNDNYSKGTAIFPLAKAWEPVDVGLNDGQPLIIDNLIFTLGGTSAVAVRKDTGEILNQVNLQSIYPHYSSGSLFALKHSNNQYQLISPSKDGRVISFTANIVRDTEGNPTGVNFLPHWSFSVTQLNREELEITSKILTQNATILVDSNSSLNKVYVGFGTDTGHMVVLDSSSGTPLTKGRVLVDSVLGSGSGITYRNFDHIIFSANKGDTGGFVGASVSNGVLTPNLKVKDDIHVDGIIGPMAYAVIDNYFSGGTNGMLVAQDKLGRIIGYDTTNDKLLFIIDHFEGNKTMNGISIAGKYLLLTFAEDINGRAKTVCINYEKAIEEAQYDEDKRANYSTLFENTFASNTYSSAIALSVAEQEFDSIGNIKETIYREVFLTAHRGTKSPQKNLNMFYLDQYNASTKKPISVPYAFQIMESEGVYKTVDGLHIEGGVFSQISYGEGYLVFIDGLGKLNAYTAIKENNLALVNFENTADLLEKGETYQAIVDVVNYTGENQDNIPIEYWINGTRVHEDRLSFGADGITVYFQYTVPIDFDEDSITIEAKLNMKTPRTLEETTYDDNIAAITMEVLQQEELDLEVTHITHSRFYKGQYGTVNVHVRNNSDQTIYNPSAPVRMRIAGTTAEFVQHINLPPKAAGTVSFRLQVPNEERDFTIIGEINHTRVYVETDYTNNTKSKVASIIGVTPSTGCVTDYTEWIEYRSVEGYSSGSKVKEHWTQVFSHYDEEEEEVGTDADGEPIYRTRRTPVYVPKLIGWDVQFYASSGASMSVSPTTIKTGYGIEVEAETWVITNYDRPWILSNMQNVYAYFSDGTSVAMIPQGSTSSIDNLKWILPQNHASVFAQRRHYIPIEWPDGNYKINIFADNANTPGGTLCSDASQTITIQGTMYEDDHTGIR